jgi:uncharacterized protein (TIGR02145 family)
VNLECNLENCPDDCDLGDVNCDGELNVLDVVLLVNMILADEYDVIADINEDGVLNVLDVVILVNLILDGEPVCEGVEDIDGNCYETIQIGEQVWMAENLKVTHYNDGSEIPNITNNGDWSGLSTGAYGDYDNNPTNSETYGRLYNWYTVDDSRGLCMEGWHVPSDEEYTVLKDYLGGGEVAGGKMKETGTEHWNSPNTGATNESGFTALPAGYRYSNYGVYYGVGNYGYFWSSSEYDSDDAWTRSLYYGSSNVFRYNYGKQSGFSIRCLKN